MAKTVRIKPDKYHPINHLQFRTFWLTHLFNLAFIKGKIALEVDFVFTLVHSQQTSHTSKLKEALSISALSSVTKTPNMTITIWGIPPLFAQLPFSSALRRQMIALGNHSFMILTLVQLI